LIGDNELGYNQNYREYNNQNFKKNTQPIAEEDEGYINKIANINLAK
jgi:hypothetical protein